MLKNDPRDYTPVEDRLNGIFRGVVEDNNDPEKMGRCRIRVFGIHTEKKNKDEKEGVPTEELIWAEPALGLFEGGQTGFGSWVVPLQGSHVFLFFENGHIMKPRFFASVPGLPTDKNHGFKEEDGFSDPDSEYPNESTQYPHKPNQLDESDYHRLSRNEGIDETIVQHKKDGKDTGVSIALNGTWDEPDPYYATEYPHNKVLSTNSGITVEIDDTPGEERIHVYHPSKSYIEIDKDGNVVVRNANDKFEIVDNDLKQHIMNNFDRTVDNNRSSKVGADENQEIGGNVTREIGGSRTDDVGNTVDQTAGGNHTIIAPTINLNP